MGELYTSINIIMLKLNSKLKLYSLALLVVVIVITSLMYLHTTRSCDSSPYVWSDYCAEKAKVEASNGSVYAMKGLFYHSGPKEWDEGISWLIMAAKKHDAESFDLLISQCGNNSIITIQLLENLASEFKYSKDYVSDKLIKSGNKNCQSISNE